MITINKQLSASAGMIGPILFVIVFILEDFFSPDYNWLSTAVSEHSLGSCGWIQITNFIVSGMLLLVFARGVAKEFNEGIASKLGPLLLTILAVCIVASGPFVTDPAPVILFSNQATWHGNVHGLLGAIAFTLMPLSCFVYYYRSRKDLKWKRFAKWSLVACFITLVGIVLLKVEQQRLLEPTAMGILVGFFQRIVLITYFSWVFSFALAIYRQSNRTEN
jgi:uncharacterized membrane protein